MSADHVGAEDASADVRQDKNAVDGCRDHLDLLQGLQSAQAVRSASPSYISFPS